MNINMFSNPIRKPVTLNDFRQKLHSISFILPGEIVGLLEGLDFHPCTRLCIVRRAPHAWTQLYSTLLLEQFDKHHHLLTYSGDCFCFEA